MSVLARLLLAVVLVAVGVAAPSYAVYQRGVPWSYRDRAGVLVSRVGAVELYSRAGEAVAGTALQPGRWVAAGDELRVAAFSRATVRTPVAEYEFVDGARGELLEGGHLSLARGLCFITVPPDAVVSLRTTGAELELLRGHYRVTANGDGLIVVLVAEGGASAGGAKATPGSLLLVSRGKDPQVTPKTTRVPLNASVDLARGLIAGTTSRGAQVYIDGKLLHADETGAFSAPLPPGNEPIVVFARDVGGDVERVSVMRPTRRAEGRP